MNPPPDDPLETVDCLEGEVRARPYLVTGGRTRARSGGVSMETVVLTVRVADREPVSSAEHWAILAQCGQPCSVAEIAALLRLPLTVALVLVDDLVAEGLLLASSSIPRPGDAIDLIERLIAGVAAL